MKIKDLEPISVPETHEYFLKLIWQRHLLNFFFEVKELNKKDPKFLKALESILENPDQKILDWKNRSFNETTKKELEHILKLVKDNK